ncbi:MAG: glucokinase [Deltaproteobacteria bacterium]|nr:glucokinase [Deltaproteobacteria bacterium]
MGMLKKDETLLAGDVGATKTHLGLFSLSDSSANPIKVQRFLNRGFEDLYLMIETFLSGASSAILPHYASFGVAGPVEKGVCRFTNIPWVVDVCKLKQRFGFKDVLLMNDLEAAGWGIALLEKGDMAVLNKGRRAHGNIALLAAGTGLGEAVLFWDGKEHIPFHSEGGHADLAGRNSIEMELAACLIDRYIHASYERVLSGEGLRTVYEFLKDKGYVSPDPKVEQRLGQDEPASVIIESALKLNDPLSTKAIDIFVSLYGAEAGNLALKCMATGGVYLAGGISHRLTTVLKGRVFLESFASKGRFESLLRRVPVYLVLNDRVALFGAFRAGRRRFCRGAK